MKEEIKTRNQIIMNKVMSGMTLEDVGNEFGISKQRVRQIISKDPRFNQRDYGGRKGYRGAYIDINGLYEDWTRQLVDTGIQIKKEKPILLDWYDNRLPVREVLQKWDLSLDEFRGILARWQRKYKYYHKKQNE